MDLCLKTEEKRGSILHLENTAELFGLEELFVVLSPTTKVSDTNAQISQLELLFN